MNEFRDFSSLTSEEQESLYRKLCSAKTEFLFSAFVDSQPNNRSIIRELNTKILKSLRRISDFGDQAYWDQQVRANTNVPSGALVDRLAQEANNWALKQEPDNLPYPFSVPGYEAHADVANPYGAAVFVHTFFRNAKLMHEFAISVLDNPGQDFTDIREMRRMSPIEQLAGARLPEIYEAIFKRKFTSQVNDTGISKGITFSILALAAMEIEQQSKNKKEKSGRYSPYTLRIHYDEARSKLGRR